MKGELRLCAVLVDGTPFKDRQIIEEIKKLKPRSSGIKGSPEG